jgi:hypothetical protein
MYQNSPYLQTKKGSSKSLKPLFLLSSGGRIRTYDLWVMSPTSYQLLHPAIFVPNIMDFIVKVKSFLLNFEPSFWSKEMLFQFSRIVERGAYGDG